MTTLVEQLKREAANPRLGLSSSADGSVALLHHCFDASTGPMGHATQLRLALALNGGGPLQQQTSASAGLNALWSVGQFNLVLPGQTGTYVSPAVEVLGLAIDWPSLHGTPFEAEALAPLANALHRDATVSALLHALWSAAETQLLSDALLHAGAHAIIRRLGQLARLPRHPASRPLGTAQLQALIDYIDASTDSRPNVALMARAVGMEETRFARALRAATGLSPYAFLTHRRMHSARIELARGRSVTTVAHAAGYANASKFAAAFRRVIGHAPSATRLRAAGTRVQPG